MLFFPTGSFLVQHISFFFAIVHGYHRRSQSLVARRPHNARPILFNISSHIYEQLVTTTLTGIFFLSYLSSPISRIDFDLYQYIVFPQNMHFQNKRDTYIGGGGMFLHRRRAHQSVLSTIFPRKWSSSIPAPATLFCPRPGYPQATQLAGVDPGWETGLARARLRLMAVSSRRSAMQAWKQRRGAR